MKNVYLVLDNIRSVHNVGSLFRTAEAAGVKKILLCGCTPAPLDRFGRHRKDLAKVALGTEKSVPWEIFKETKDAILVLKKEGVEVLAIEQSEKSKVYSTYVPKGAYAVVSGEETKGLREDVLSLCDAILEIPMHGKKESLNVSVATGIVLFRLLEH